MRALGARVYFARTRKRENGKEGSYTNQVAGGWRSGQPGASGRPRARPARRQHHGVRQGVQRPDAGDTGTVIPVVITVYEDRSFTFITKQPPAAVLIKQALDLDKGSAEPHREQGRADHRRAAVGDRREEDEGSERERHRGGEEDHRRHRAFDGRGGGLMASTASHTWRRASASTVSASTQPAEAIALVKQLSTRQVQRVGRGACPHRPERPPRRRAAARHDRAAQRPRQGRQGRGLRAGRQGARGRGGRRRRGRRRGPRQAHPRTASTTSTWRSRRRT